MVRKRINIRAHLRHLRSGKIIKVKRHKRMIQLRARDDRSRRDDRRPRQDDRRGRDDQRSYGDRQKREEHRKWQFTQKPEMTDKLLENIDGRDKKERKTVTAYWLNYYLSFFTLSRDPQLKEILLEQRPIIGIAATPTRLETAKVKIDLKEKKDDKKLPRGFDRRPAINIMGEQISTNHDENYNPIKYVAEKNDIALIPIVDHESIYGTYGRSSDGQDEFKKQLSEYIHWMRYGKGKEMKRDFNLRTNRNWRGNFRAPSHVFVSEFTEREVGDNKGQIPLTGYVNIKKIGRRKYRGKEIDEYDVIDRSEDPMYLKPIGVKGQKQTFLYRYPTVFSGMNHQSRNWLQAGRSDWRKQEIKHKEDRYKKDFNSWIRQRRQFHHGLPKDLKGDLDQLKQLKIPATDWEKSDFELYSTYIKMHTGVDKVAEAGLDAPPSRMDYGLAKHKKKRRK